MITKRALITDDVHNHLIQSMHRWGWTVDYRPDISPSLCKEIVGDYHVLVINSKIEASQSFLNAASNLEVIARLGSGLDIIDLVAARERNITVINSPEGNRMAVAEHTCGMILAYYNNLLLADRDVRHMSWYREQRRGGEINEKTLGIVGFGNTGQSLARVMSALGVTLFIYDPYISPDKQKGTWVPTLDELAKVSDIISFHVPLTQETRYMANMQLFRTMKPGALLVNTSRGSVVKTIDLVEALEQKLIGGACLDVFENEKPQFYSKQEIDLYSRLFKMNHVVLSPHVAGWTNESKRKIADTLVSKLKKRYELE